MVSVCVLKLLKLRIVDVPPPPKPQPSLSSEWRQKHTQFLLQSNICSDGAEVSCSSWFG